MSVKAKKAMKEALEYAQAASGKTLSKNQKQKVAKKMLLAAQAAAAKIKNSKAKASSTSEIYTKTSLVINSYPPENSMLNSKKLCVLRPELLAILDFQSINANKGLAEGKNLKLFKARVAKRKMQLESAVMALESAIDSDYDNYLVAKTQYESALAAAASEIAFLKIAYTFKVYAELGPSFTSFIKFYNFSPEEYTTNLLDTSSYGENFYDYMLKTMGWKNIPGILQGTIDSGKDATLLLQLINDLSFSCAIATPSYAIIGNRFSLNKIQFPLIPQPTSNTQVLNIFGDITSAEINLNQSNSGVIRLCRDLTASTQLGKIIAAEGDEDEVLKSALEKYVAADYFSSTTAPSPSLFKNIFGWDPYGSYYKNLTSSTAGQKYFHFVPDFSTYKSGVVSELFTIDGATAVVSTDSDSYQTSEAIGPNPGDVSIPEKTFAGVKSLVDAGFSTSGQIDLGLYSSQISKLQDNLEDASNIYTQLFKLLDKRGSILGETGTLAQNSHPTSPLNFNYNVQKLMNDRYYKNFGKYIGLNPSLLVDGENSHTASVANNSEEFYKCWGIHFILCYPEISKDIIKRFVEDYEKGFLTFSENVKVEEVTYHVSDKEGDTTIEVEVRENVYPGTEISTDLSGQRGGLYSFLGSIPGTLSKDPKTSTVDLKGGIQNISRGSSSDQMTLSIGGRGYRYAMWAPYSPTATFCGTIDTELFKQLRKDFPETQHAPVQLAIVSDNVNTEGARPGSDRRAKGVVADVLKGAKKHSLGPQLFLRTAMDIKSTISWQQACVMWVKNPNAEGYLPANIIPVAGCIIDAVMTILYNCLSPTMEIVSTATTDPWFPSVESKAPPYNKQLFSMLGGEAIDIGLEYIGGMGSFSSINTQYWIPVLNAVNKNLARSEDKTMLFSGAPVSSILGGVIDAINSSGRTFSGNFGCTLSNNVNEGHQTVPVKLQCFRPAQYSNELQIPQWGTQPTVGGLGYTRVFDLGSLNSETLREEDKNNLEQQYLQGDIGVANDNSFLISGLRNAEGDGSLAYSTTGLFLFGSITSLKSNQEWVEMIKNAASSSGGEYSATPSQLLDRLTSEASTPTEVFNIFVKKINEQFKVLLQLEAAATTSGQTQNIRSYAVTHMENLLAQLEAARTASKNTNGQIYATSSTAALEGTYKNMINVMDNFDPMDLTAASGSSISDLQNSFTAYAKELVESNLHNNWKKLPAGIWLIHNLAGSESGNPILELLSKDIDTLTTGNSSGDWNSLLSSSIWWQEDSEYGSNLLYRIWTSFAINLVNSRDEDIKLGVAFDIIKKYAQRIATYAETAVDGLTTEDSSDQSALELLLSELGETTAGNHVLGNLTPDQLRLKTASLNRLAGDASKGYISKSEIITQKHLAAIKLMLNVSSLSGDEGSNIKNSVIGIPATLFSTVYDEKATYTGPAKNSASNFKVSGKNSPLFGIKASANLPDYPLFSCIPKMFRFDYEVFALPDIFDRLEINDDGILSLDGRLIDNWEKLVSEAQFTRYRFLAVEGTPGDSEAIVKVDYEEKEVYNELYDLDQSNENFYDIYSNILASYLLEIYYKLTVGLGAGEDDFSTAGSGLEIPINEYAIDFASALGSIYTDLESGLDSTKIESLFMPLEDIEALSYNTLSTNVAANASVSTYSNMVSEFSTEIAAGEFTEVESSLFESFTNASTSRLFSAESMRDKILSANYFDRVLYVLVDPDEFSIASWEYYLEELQNGLFLRRISHSVGPLYKGYQEMLLNSGEIEVSTRDSSTNNIKTMKIVKRKDEGHLSFGSLMFSIVRDVSTGNKAYGVDLSETDKCDTMIVE